MLSLKGRLKKTLTVEDNFVKIIKGAGLFNSEREKLIPIKNITAVDIKKPGAFVVGYIQIQIAGQMSGNASFTTTGGSYNAVQDENSVVFAKMEDYEIALKIRDYILARI